MSHRKAISPSFGVLAGLAEWIGTSSMFGERMSFMASPSPCEILHLSGKLFFTHRGSSGDGIALAGVHRLATSL